MLASLKMYNQFWHSFRMIKLTLTSALDSFKGYWISSKWNWFCKENTKIDMVMINLLTEMMSRRKKAGRSKKKKNLIENELNINKIQSGR